MMKLKKILSYSPFLLFILYLILPMMRVIGYKTGYGFQLYHYTVSILSLAILSIAAPVVLKLYGVSLGEAGKELCVLLLPLSIINGFLYKPSDVDISIAFSLLCFIGALLMLILFVSDRIEIIVASVISGVMFSVWLLSILVLAFVAATGPFGSYGEIKSVASPENTYIARVMDDDQGALGGSTRVIVENTQRKVVNVWIGEFEYKAPQINVYSGRWGEGEEMQIWWKDENILVINGKEIDIRDK